MKFLIIAALLLCSVVARGELPSAGVATSHPIATEVGEAVLADGGNAFDAAVAISAVLAVVEPHRSGLGGGGFYLLHRESDGFQVMVDARETAPSSATWNMYLDDEGNVIENASRFGATSAGIPGEPAAFVHITEKYGRLSLEKNLSYAIQYARNGFPVYEHYQSGLTRKAELMRGQAAGKVYLDRGQVPEAGYIVKQRDLAKTMERLAAKGHAGFYEGKVAKALVKGVTRAGGHWQLQDLANYRVLERAPLVGEYKGIRVVSVPPPSAGGMALISSLNILSGFDLSESGVSTTHLTVEAMRRAFRDRSQFLGDTDFVSVPIDKLTHPFYADGLRASIRQDKAGSSLALAATEPDGPKGTETTHFSIIDQEGNRVSASLSLNWWYGSGFMVPGTGVLLNNQMDDFASKPGTPNGFALLGGRPNAIAPNKRMLSSMTPTFLESDRGVAVLGTPGGSRIISMVLLATLAWSEGATAEQMVALPRFHHQYLPDEVFFEPGALSEEAQRELEAMGHVLRESSRLYGNMQVVIWDKQKGIVEVGIDPRGYKDVLVY
ncbi:MAG: gamma-glutamyltransferase [Pseudomonadota bacterium]